MGVFEQHEETFSILMCQSTMRGHKEMLPVWGAAGNSQAMLERVGLAHSARAARAREVFTMFWSKRCHRDDIQKHCVHYPHELQPVSTKILNLEPSNFASPLHIPHREGNTSSRHS